jgi:hypothetical protein
MDSNEAKVMRIKKDMLLSIDVCYVLINQWVVKSDFYNAISWIKEKKYYVTLTPSNIIQ